MVYREGYDKIEEVYRMITYTLKELGYPEDPTRKLLPWINMELRWKNLRKKAWIIIRLDDVDPEDIFYSLSDYKYFDAQTESFDEFIKVVHKKLKEC